MRAKSVEREAAIRLRVEERLSVPEIAALLKVSKASLSVWLREYPLPEESLRQRRADNGRRSSFAQAASRSPRPTFTPSLHASSVHKGALAVLKVEQRAAERGIVVSRPTVECPYDLILDDGGKLLRVQVKYADGRACNSTGVAKVTVARRHKGSRFRDQPYSRQDIDLVLVYVPKRDCVIALGPDLFEQQVHFSLRYEAPRNGVLEGTRTVESLAW